MSILSRLNPANVIPRFPAYTGPYAVGSFELEIPVTSLGSVDGVAETVQFRVFYPTRKPAEAPACGWWSRCDKKHKQKQEEKEEKHKQKQGEKEDKEEKEEKLKEEENASSTSKPVRWLPEPYQREYLSAYARFLGASSGFAEIVSLLHYISLPVIADAPLLPAPAATPDFRFPTMIFSHGLGGTRLAYSHICCSIASYGVVVVAPEHRDGSAPVSFVKTAAAPKNTHETQIRGTKPSSGEPGIDESSSAGKHNDGRVQVDYVTYPHHVSDETANGRNRQLEIRLREIALVYSALSQLDAGRIPTDAMISTDEAATGTTTGHQLLRTLQNRLDIRDPGRVIWAGHSFGASTMFQFIKSLYASPPDQPLFTATSPALKAQITPASPLLLLDLWCLPLLGRRTSNLFKQPLPQTAGPSPRKVLVVMSDEFWRWKDNLHGVRRALSPDPGRARGGDANRWFEQWDDAVVGTGDQIIPPPPSTTTATPPTPAAAAAAEKEAEADTGPRCYYVKNSAHLSQSDFGILFPRVIRGAQEPERILELNVRAVVQWLREAGFILGGGEADVGDGEIFGGVVEGWCRVGLAETGETGGAV